MAKYYFDIETYGPNISPSPFTDKIITIQYQLLDDTTGRPTGELVILKEWESSEKEILLKFLPMLKKWEFIMVGNNLGYERRFLIEKARQINWPNLNEYSLNYEFPAIDLQSLFVILNEGKFKGSGMHNFTEKKMDGSRIKGWYENKDFAKIEEYVKDEAAGFIKLYSELSEKLPQLFPRKDSKVEE
ncbi:hypothetical protein HY989_06750 [Candidatus Micrarchaeota archaeon]|nr:hypothetical protein [Candidatus Micrarchaeota archaeon]